MARTVKCVCVCVRGYLNYEVDQLVLEHLFRVEVCNKETDVIALCTRGQKQVMIITLET